MRFKIMIPFILFALVISGCEVKTDTSKTSKNTVKKDLKISPLEPKLPLDINKKIEVNKIEPNIDNGISVYGKVGKSVNSITVDSGFEYHVVTTAKNISKETIKFDVIVASFITSNNKGISWKRGMPYPKAWMLNPGESKNFDHVTNNYTKKLLSEAGDDPITFSIEFKYRGKVIAGPFRADLPNHKKLPSYDESLTNDSVKLPTIEFIQHRLIKLNR